MKLYRIVVGPIQENCYLIKNEETGEGIIIDPGDEALKIMEAVKKAGIKKITAIFITHGHGDHISALDEVKKLTGAKVYMSREDAPMLRVWNSSLSYSTDRDKTFDPPDVYFEDGMTVTEAGLTFTIAATPGHTLLQDYFRPHLKELCEDCQSRFDRSPLRILDCKVDHDKPFMAGAPKITDSLCEECHDHFEMVKKLLDEAGVDYEVDSTLVRGLDYYTKTAYEVQYSPLGAQSAVGGGGRYDGLVEELGGPSTPGVGFAMGLERIILALEKQGLLKPEKEAIDVFAVVPDEGGTADAFKAVMTLREAGYSCDMNQIGRSMKAQMKQADRTGARFALIFGEEERSRGAVTVRNMADSSQEEIKRSEIVSYMKKAEV